jgi:hypothetical protein
MKATLVVHEKFVRDGGAIVEVKVWRLPHPTAERPHGLKYSLFYGTPGERVVGYDNESGKGDHKHLREVESRYRFSSFEKLMTDFWRDVRKEIDNE